MQGDMEPVLNIWNRWSRRNFVFPVGREVLKGQSDLVFTAVRVCHWPVMLPHKRVHAVRSVRIKKHPSWQNCLAVMAETWCGDYHFTYPVLLNRKCIALW